MPQYPKFQAQVRNKVVEPSMRQVAQPGYALVLSFDPLTNTCSIVTTSPGSDELGEVMNRVPVPMQPGVQGQAPKPGVMCWITYRSGTHTDPFITHFFEVNYSQFQYANQYQAVNDTPRFMVTM